MRRQLLFYIDSSITFLLLLVAGITPLLFATQTTEFYEMPKLLFLIISTLLLLGLWIFSWILKGKVVINRTPLDLPLLLILGVVIASTFFSASKYIGIYGNFPRVHGSAVSWVTYILLYFVTVSNLKTVSKIKVFLYTLYASATIVALVSLFSFFRIFLPMDFAKAVNFTPTGSSFSTLAFLLLFLPLPLLSLINPNKYMPLPFAMALSILFGVTITLIGSLPSLIVLLIIFVLCAFVSKIYRFKKTLALFLIPAGVVLFTLFLSYVPFSNNPLQSLEANFPKEIQLPFPISWKVTASAFRDAPFVGTGPSTYLFDFTSYKPIEFNALAFWNVSFDTAYNEFLQVLATLGGFGLVSLIVLGLVILNLSWKNLSLDDPDAKQDNTHVLIPSLALSGIVAVMLLGIHATTLVSLFATFFVLAALMMSQKSIREKVVELSMGISASTSDNKKLNLFPILIFIAFVGLVAPVAYNGYFVVAADYYHRLALSQSNKNGSLTYQYLQKAEALNPRIDSYRIDMAQTNFALANAIAIQKGPKKPGDAGSLTDQDKRTIQTLLSQAINEGRVAVTLNPLSSRNWEVLALIYRNIAGVANNSLTFSLDSYGRAIQRDPLNPALRISVGGIYSTVKNYDLATRFYTDAINLKPDYANAYYNLALTLQEKGDLTSLQNAFLVAQQAMVLLQKTPKSPDYKIASDLVDSLKGKVVEGTKQAQQDQAAQQQAAGTLSNAGAQNSNLQNVTVPNLNNPPSVTPVPAVKANPNARIPVSPVPSVSPVVSPAVTATP